MIISILSIILLVMPVMMPAAPAPKKIVYPPGAKAGGNFSPGILVAGTLYVSGNLGLDANGKIPESFEAEVQQSLDHIDAVLKAAGMSRDDVVSVQVYLTDLSNFQRMNAVYANHFKDPRPTRTTVGVAALVNGGHIEITATARK
jgi:2-iminobutanoate/2-iminopropanoate deaminase